MIKKKYIFVLICICYSHFLFSQKNVSKSNLLYGPFFKTYSVIQERAIGSRFSIQTTVKVRPPRGLSPAAQDLFKIDEAPSNPFANSKLSGIGNITEFRIYRQDKALRGIYFGVLFSFMHHKLESGVFPGTFHDENNVEYYADLTQAIKINLTGLGIELGLQGLIKDRVCIDWTILSFGYSLLSLTGSIDATNTSANFDFRNYTSDIDKSTFGVEKWLPIKKIVEKETVGFNVKAPWPIIKSTLCIGFAYGGKPKVSASAE